MYTHKTAFQLTYSSICFKFLQYFKILDHHLADIKVSKFIAINPSNSDRDYSLHIDAEVGDTITGRNIVATLKNGALLTTSSNYKYVELDGVNDYIDLGNNSNNCLGNVELCPVGLTLSMWVFPTKLQDGRQW